MPKPSEGPSAAGGLGPPAPPPPAQPPPPPPPDSAATGSGVLATNLELEHELHGGRNVAVLNAVVDLLHTLGRTCTRRNRHLRAHKGAAALQRADRTDLPVTGIVVFEREIKISYRAVLV